MKQFFYIISLSILIFAKEPLWLENDPKDGAIYFRGISTSYQTNDALVQEVSQQDALHSGYSKVSDYFGINIKSNVTITKQSDKNGLISNMNKTIKTKTNQIIFDLKPFKTYKKYSDDKSYFRLHVLLRLDKNTEQKIKHQMQKDKDEFKTLQNEILNQIDKKNFFKAKNLLSVAKGKRMAYIDDTLMTIEKRLNDILDKLLVSSLTINKKVYLPNEPIAIESSLNQDGYLYILYDTGDTIEMLFPNKYRKNNYLKNQELITLPNENINQILAYEESKGLDTAIWAIASKQRLSLKRYQDDEIDGVYIFNNWSKIKPIISKYHNQAQCFTTKIKFKIVNSKKSNIQIVFNTSNIIKIKLERFLKSQGIKNIVNKNKIIFNITKEKRYSKMLEEYMITYTIKTIYIKNSKKFKIGTMECNEYQLNDTILKLYNSIN